MKTLLSLVHQHRLSLLVLLGFWGTYFIRIFLCLLQPEADALYIGHEHAWTDWPIHISMASTFAHQPPQNWFVHHPLYADGGLKYTFLVNLISGLLMRLGLSVSLAFALPSILYALSLIVGLYALFYLLLRSQKQAVAAIFLFFLSSGPGFVGFFNDLLDNPSLETLLYPPQMYSRVDQYSWYSGNVISGFLVPQRSFLLGATLAVWALVGLIYGVTRSQRQPHHRWILAAAGLFTGVLPLAHMHSFLAIAIIAAPLCGVTYLTHKSAFDWLYFAVPAGVLSVTLYMIFLSGGVSTAKFLTFYPGWNATGGLVGWIGMWLKLWGVMLPIALGGLWLVRNRPLWTKAVFLGFVAIFVLTNIVLFQPVTWDNSKLFFWAYLGFCGLAVIALTHLWQTRTKVIGKLDVIVLVVALTLTGALETLRLQRAERNRMYFYSQADLALATQIRQETAPDARFLTAPAHNHFIMTWAARPILMGFTGWLANFGFDYQQREADLKIMFGGGTAAESVLRKYQVSYVTVGPGERGDFDVDETYFAENYPVAFENDGYRIYDVRSLLTQAQTP